MPNTFDDIRGLPNPLTYAGVAVLAAACVLMYLAWPYLPRVPERMAPPARIIVHHADIRTAYLRIRPKARPWHGSTEGEYAARAALCLGWPQDLQDSLAGFKAGLAPAEDFRMMHPFFVARVAPDGRCSREKATVLVRDVPRLGAMDISGIRTAAFTQLYIVELAPLPDGSRRFAYRTE